MSGPDPLNPTNIAASRAGVQAMTATEDDDVPLALLSLRCSEFDLSDIPGAPPGEDTLRFVANEEDVLSSVEGAEHRYVAWGFDYVPAAQGLSGNPGQLRMDNVDRRITQAIKLLPSDAQIQCRVFMVLSGDVDTAEQISPLFKMTAIDFDELNIAATISTNDDSRAPLCDLSYGRSVTPGLHA